MLLMTISAENSDTLKIRAVFSPSNSIIGLVVMVFDRPGVENFNCVYGGFN